jgi:hypothetical protein
LKMNQKLLERRISYVEETVCFLFCGFLLGYRGMGNP